MFPGKEKSSSGLNTQQWKRQYWHHRLDHSGLWSTTHCPSKDQQS